MVVVITKNSFNFLMKKKLNCFLEILSSKYLLSTIFAWYLWAHNKIFSWAIYNFPTILQYSKMPNNMLTWGIQRQFLFWNSTNSGWIFIGEFCVKIIPFMTWLFMRNCDRRTKQSIKINVFACKKALLTATCIYRKDLPALCTWLVFKSRKWLLMKVYLIKIT